MALSSGRKIVVEFIGDASSLRANAKEGEAALQGFSGKAQAAGKIAGKALAGGLLLAGAAAVSATKAAADDAAGQAQLAQQLKQAANASDTQIASVEDWITKASLATGVTDDELRPAFAKLATATGDVESAQGLLTEAMDIAAGSGQSLESVTKTLAKAQTTGSIAAYAKLGGATKDAHGNTLSLADATQALADKYKGAAATAADTTAGKTKIMQVQFGELQEQIGAKLLPVMSKLAEVGLKVIDWISKNTTTVGILLGALSGLLAITTAVGAATKAFGAIQTVWSAATKIAAAAQWLLNAALEANPIGLVVVAIAALVAGFILAYKHSETFRNIVNAAFDAVKTVVLGAVHGIADAVGWVIKFVEDHWKLILSILTGPIGAAAIFIATHWDAIKAKTSAVWDAVKTAITTPISAALNIVKNVASSIKDGLSNAWDKVRDNAATAFAAVRDGIKDKLGAALDFIQAIPGKIKSAFTGIWDGLAAGLKSAVNAVLHLPLVIPKIDTHIPGVGTVGGQTLIPALAKGGIVTRPTVALIGEAGPEAVIPLSRRGGGGAAGAAGAPIYVTIQTPDPRTAGDYIIKALREVERTTGRQILVSPA